MANTNRFSCTVRPTPPAANVYAGSAFRFTVLTDRLIRLEYSQTGVFEDRASQSVFFRDFPEVSFCVKKQEDKLVLETEKLVLTYKENSPFSNENLQIQLKDTPNTLWHFGDEVDNLGGTTKTLDTVDGACDLENGVCSRSGVAVIDDSNTLVLEEDGWIGVRAENTKDVYFFGYGLDYIGAVQALYKLTGAPPMLPAYALGNWWSRYHQYTQQEYCDLIDRFHREDIPFSVSVVDMDWHIVKIPEDQKYDYPPAYHLGWGWTGYSWNKELFPDYKAFLKYLKRRNLHTALNLHPADGVCRHEDMYPEMAKACGIDPASGEQVKLDILNQEFMAKYFDILHHPYEEDGVDFWWMDWQQGTDYHWIHEANAPGQYNDPRERMDPLWLLNHLHIQDISRSGKRPMFFSRYAGPGSHRYPVGFSGDTIVTWDSLQFQPYFTATSSNIGYSWWSHDIGGHMKGYRDDEMQVRWLQLGVFSPILRLHSTNSDFQRKEPWCYNPEAERIMKQCLKLRHSLFPYLYTMNYRNHVQGLPLVQPMYYSHPATDNAYNVPGQFWFGSELIAAPITQKLDSVSRLAEARVWLPQGDWFDMTTGVKYTGKEDLFSVYRSLDQVPVFAKAGGIVPMAKYPAQDNRLTNPEQMKLLVFPGASNQFCLYEDAGEGYAYKKGEFAKTSISLDWGTNAKLTISPVQGDLSVIPARRSWEIVLRGWNENITVTADGETILSHSRYDAATHSTVITVSSPVTRAITLTVSGKKLANSNEDVLTLCSNILQAAQTAIVTKESWMKLLKGEGSAKEKLALMKKDCDQYPGLLAALQEVLLNLA